MIATNNLSISKSQPLAGFSLVEVTLALGIAAIGMSIVFALIPASMDNMRKAAGMSSEHRIANRLFGEIRAGRWELVDNFNDTFRYFDAYSLALDTAEDTNRIYTARIQVTPDEEMTESRRIVIDVTDRPDFEKAFSEATQLATFSAFTTSFDK